MMTTKHNFRLDDFLKKKDNDLCEFDCAEELDDVIAGIRSDIRVDLIEQALLSLGCQRHKMISSIISPDYIARFLLEFEIKAYGEFFYDEKITENNWVDWWISNPFMDAQTFTRLAVDDFVLVMKEQIRNGEDRSFLCRKKDREEFIYYIYYYGRDTEQKKDYLFQFERREGTEDQKTIENISYYINQTLNR